MLQAETTFSPETREWLEKRTTIGHWIDIQEDDIIPHEVIGFHRTLLHMFQLTFAPEIRNRIDQKQLDEHFTLNAAQLIQFPSGDKIVRLNEEVRGIAAVIANAEDKVRENFYYEQFTSLQNFDLIEEELDCGHFTIFRTNSSWVGKFDFRNSRQECLETLNIAEEFLDCSCFAADQNYSRVCVDTLFSSCELIAKAHLLLTRHSATKAKTHGSIHSAANQWSKFGNLNQSFVQIYNQLAQQRTKARYETGQHISLPSAADREAIHCEITSLKDAVKHILAEN